MKLVSDVVVEHQGKVLLIKRGHAPFKGHWALPGGFVDDGETAEQAAVREVKEETGLDVTLNRIITVGSDPNRDPRGHHVSVVFLATPKSFELQTSEETPEVNWFDWDSALALDLGFDHKQFLEKAKKA